MSYAFFYPSETQLLVGSLLNGLGTLSVQTCISEGPAWRTTYFVNMFPPQSSHGVCSHSSAGARWHQHTYLQGKCRREPCKQRKRTHCLYRTEWVVPLLFRPHCSSLCDKEFSTFFMGSWALDVLISVKLSHIFFMQWECSVSVSCHYLHYHFCRARSSGWEKLMLSGWIQASHQQSFKGIHCL